VLHFTKRKAAESDVPFLFELRMKSMEPHHVLAGISQSEAEAMARVRAYLDVAQIIEANGQSVGLLKVLEESESLRIVQLQFLPTHQGLGVGTSLVRAVLEQAHAQGTKVTLSVLRVSHARRLYERLGFRVVGEDEFSFHMESEA
jgi:ribosomal protein S18 acetylase RimI-like enzyme